MAKKKEPAVVLSLNGITTDLKSEPDPVPVFTLGADEPLHIRCMIAVVNVLQNEAYGSPVHLGAVAKLREFEMYEEAHR